MSLGRLLCELRAGAAPHREQDLTLPVTAFAGKELLQDRVVRTLTVILRTRGCSWARSGGCTMCGYPAESASRCPTEDELLSQLENAMDDAGAGPFPIVKLYTSGSFLDPAELTPQVAVKLLSALPDGTEKVVVESRPQYVKKEILEKFISAVPGLEVAIGLESASDRVRKNCVNKGFTFTDYARAAETARGAGAGVRTYLLLKPPFLSERAAVEDVKTSLLASAPYSDHLSLNLTTVQRGTYVEYLWQRRGYRPPWLWSAVDIARWWVEEGVKNVKLRSGENLHLTVDPVGAGSARGPHNCRKYDRYAAASIRQFSHTQDAHEFDSLRCGCRGLYEKYVELEEKAFGASLLR